MVYVGYFTKKFNKSIRKLDGSITGRINNQIDTILEDPFHNTVFLSERLKGKRKKRIGDLRIIFIICNECKEKNHKRFNNCVECDEKDDTSIIFFDVGFRGGIYD